MGEGPVDCSRADWVHYESLRPSPALAETADEGPPAGIVSIRMVSRSLKAMSVPNAADCANRRVTRSSWPWCSLTPGGGCLRRVIPAG